MISGYMLVSALNVIPSQIEEQSLPFFAKAMTDRECPYDPTALTFKVCTHMYMYM